MGTNDRSRKSSACFTSLTRKQWENLHATKIESPEVGKYNPNFSYVEKKGLTTKLRAKPQNFGSERIKQRELQHSYICPHTLQVLNDPSTNTRKLSKRISQLSMDFSVANTPKTGTIITNRPSSGIEGLIQLNINKNMNNFVTETS